MSKDASAADDALPVSAAEADRLFRSLDSFPVLILAVSGGPDSTALMVLAARWRATCEDPPKLIAVTVDHGLRAESNSEAEAVAQLANSLGIEHRTLHWSGPKPATGLQQAARLARYRLLCDAARSARADSVLTGHTLDDQAETVLFRLARGSGISGLAGMSAVAPMPIEDADGIMLLRPLLSVPKSRLVATLKTENISYADDPTNRDPRFARPRLRELLPALAREGLTAQRLATFARRIERAEDALHQAAKDALVRVTSMPWPDEGAVTIDEAGFADLPQEIGMRLLGFAIAHTGDEGPVELAKLEELSEAIYAAIAESIASIGERRRFRRTLAGAVVTLSDGQITVERAPPRRSRREKRDKSA